MREELREAEALLTAGDPHAALSLLASAHPQGLETTSSDTMDAKLYMKLKTACIIQLAVHKDASWWEVFALDSATATATDVKRQFKRLASLVHPDKSILATAEETFKSLTRGMEDLLKEIEGGVARKGAKRARHEEMEESEDDDGDEQEEHETCEANNSAENEYAWWTTWDNEIRSRSSSRRKKEVDVSEEEREKEEILKDRLELGAMSVAELQEEVRRRQNTMLNPPRTNGAVTSIDDLRKALVRARTVLKDKVDATETEALHHTTRGGGFLI